VWTSLWGADEAKGVLGCQWTHTATLGPFLRSSWCLSCVPQRRRACAIQRAYRWEGVVHHLINAAQTVCDAVCVCVCVCVCVYAFASELCCARVGVHNKAEQAPQGPARGEGWTLDSESGSLPAQR